MRFGANSTLSVSTHIISLNFPLESKIMVFCHFRALGFKGRKRERERERKGVGRVKEEMKEIL